MLGHGGAVTDASQCTGKRKAFAPEELGTIGQFHFLHSLSLLCPELGTLEQVELDTTTPYSFQRQSKKAEAATTDAYIILAHVWNWYPYETPGLARLSGAERTV
jgi:hypothetical protein